MKDRKWWHSSIVYQVYPRSFKDTTGSGIGDLNGIIQKLDYLKNLGIDVIWLSPVYKSPNDDMGYDISDYMDIMEEFGTMEDMDKLLEEAKVRNIKIIMDLVVNHTSDEHKWFIEGRKNKENKYHDYYVWRDKPNELTSTFCGSAWKYNEATDEYYLHLFGEKQPDLNWENESLRKEIYKMMNFWLEKGIGGFRMDVIDLIGKEPDNLIKENGKMLHLYLQEMQKNTFANYDVLTVGETWGVTPEIAKLYSSSSRNELSMVFQFEHMSVDKIQGKRKWDLAPVDFIMLKQILTKWQLAFADNDGWNSLFWNNHDLGRVVSRFGNDKTEQFRVLSAKMLATVLHMQKGTPYIYQGEEIGMTNIYFDSIDKYKDIEAINTYKERLEAGHSKEEVLNSLKIKGRDNARTPMQWDKTKNAGFTDGEPWLSINDNYKHINVQDALLDENSIFYHYQNLIKIRKKFDVVIFGHFDLLYKEHKNIYSYIREDENDKILVVCNFYETEVIFKLPQNIKYKKAEILLSNYEDSPIDISEVNLRAYEAIIYKLV